MNGPRIGRAITATMVMGFLLPGCQEIGTTAPPIRLLTSPRVYERDIPLPTGFRIVDQLGESRSTGTRRLYLRHVYEGRADKYAVRNFYEEQMPLLRWAKVSDGMVGGIINFRYEKENESCSIDIRDAGSRKTRVQVIVAQEERASAPPKRAPS